MSCKKIFELRPGDPPQPLEIRILKKWVPFTKEHEKKRDVCYLFVDTHGDAIEATADLAKEAYFDSIFEIQSCYTVDMYVTIPSRTYMPVVQHHAALRLGERATFVPITRNDLPTNYYRFASYTDLPARTTLPFLLTDYIGRIEDVTGILIRVGKRLRKVTIQDDRKHTIVITLWREKADLIGKDDTIGKVLAVTATKVTKFQEKLQLDSTNATTVDINPQIPNLQMYMNTFKELGEPSHQHTTEKRATLAELKSMPIGDNMQNRFTCTAAVVHIPDNRAWYYVTCSECPNKAYTQHNDFVCEDHGILKAPIFMYCVNATIRDDTTTADVVFFNDGMSDMLKTSCRDMVLLHGNINPKTAPATIHNIKGIEKLLHVNLRKDKPLAVNKVEDIDTFPPITPEPKTTMKRSLHLPPGTESSNKAQKH